MNPKKKVSKAKKKIEKKIIHAVFHLDAELDNKNNLLDSHINISGSPEILSALLASVMSNDKELELIVRLSLLALKGRSLNDVISHDGHGCEFDKTVGKKNSKKTK